MRHLNKAQRNLIKVQLHDRFVTDLNKVTKSIIEPYAPKFIGNGQKRIERQQRESYQLKSSGTEYLPRNMCDANLRVVCRKVSNLKHNRPEYEHLCFNWL